VSAWVRATAGITLIGLPDMFNASTRGAICRAIWTGRAAAARGGRAARPTSITMPDKPRAATTISPTARTELPRVLALTPEGEYARRAQQALDEIH